MKRNWPKYPIGSSISLQEHSYIRENAGRKWISFDGEYWVEVFRWEDRVPHSTVEDGVCSNCACVQVCEESGCVIENF